MPGTMAHVVLVTEQVDPGGKRSHVVALRAGLELAGWRVTLFDSHELTWAERGIVAAPGRLLNLVRPGLGHRWLLPSLNRAFGRRLRAISTSTDVAVWHAQEPGTFLAVRRASETGVVALTVHGPMHREVASGYGLELEHPTVVWIRELERQAYLAADAVIAVDRSHAEYVRGFGRSKAIWVVPNFVDTRAFYPEVAPDRCSEATERAIGSRPVVLCPRRLVPKNGVETAIRSMRLLAERSTPCLLLVAGDGPQGHELRRLTEEIGAQALVRFLGVVPPARMPGLCRRADVVVVPSVPHKGIEEATSISVLEAQACGRPVVASAIGGLREVVDDGANGLLVPPGDAVALADALERLIRDRSLGAKLGAVAAAQVASEHSHVTGARSYAAIYRELGCEAKGAVSEVAPVLRVC